MNEEELVYGVGSGYTSGAVNSGARLAPADNSLHGTGLSAV